MASAKVVLKRHLKAPPSEVFEACINPRILAQWFGPKAFDVCEVKVDPRVGGRFSFTMQSDRGKYGAEGIYREIQPPSRIVLTWTWTEGPEGEEPDGVQSLVTFDLKPEGDGTLLMLIHEALLDQESADNHGEGWSEALDKLEQLLLR